MSERRPSGAGGRAVFPLWGGEAAVAVSDAERLDAALEEVRRVTDRFDVACSSFRTDSELVRLNASPGQDVTVSELLLTAIREALRVARETDGAVDPTVGRALIAHGINPPMGDQRFRVEAVSGYATVRLGEASQSVRLPVGVTLDLGATAKALAADQAASAAAEAAGCGVLVGLCGDVAAAGTAPKRGWSIRVTDDHRRPDSAGQTVVIDSGGLATSSITVRQVAHGGEIAHHLIDPATGRPAVGPWRTVSVYTNSCLDANAASTAAMILGDAAPEWCAQRGLPARFVGHDGTARHSAGWPAEHDDLAAGL